MTIKSYLQYIEIGEGHLIFKLVKSYQNLGLLEIIILN